ncbi:hypothetical protein PORY_000916 [Pneumocystis oryctolagi]|uniref:Uncharacterized protein n=1 Tax=Pneumocystis oryctolagi TaxID=42067 RepID=A0ACB7CEB4_9ASCO|nr:hypothetical protein PORY_000916 [Pneumocystis oryctolagi]
MTTKKKIKYVQRKHIVNLKNKVYINQHMTDTYDSLEYPFSRKKTLRCTLLHHSIQPDSPENSLRAFRQASNNILDPSQGYQSGIYQTQSPSDETIHNETESSSSDEGGEMSHIQINPMYFTNHSKTNMKNITNIDKTNPLLQHEDHISKTSREFQNFSQKQHNYNDLFTLSSIQSDPVKQEMIKNKLLTPKPKTIQRIITNLLEESMPVESEIRNEALLSKILRKSKYIDDRMNFYNNVTKKKGPENVIEDLPMITPTREHSFHLNSSCGFHSAKKTFTSQQKRDIHSIVTKDDLMFSPSMKNKRESKRKVHCDERFEPYLSFKRRAISPNLKNNSAEFVISSPPFLSKGSIFPMQGGQTDQRWSAYGRSGLGETHKHSGGFEHETACATSFGGLPPLSQAFSTYPQYPARIAPGYLDTTPYPSHATQGSVHLGQPHTVAVAPASRTPQSLGPPGSFTYSGSSNGGPDIHGYFASNRPSDDIFSSSPHYINPPPSTSTSSSTSLGSALNSNINSNLGAASGTSLSSVSNAVSNTVPSSVSSSGVAAYSSSGLETRLPINGQPHRLSSTYSSMGPLAPDPLPTQHFWPNYTVHGHTVADRAPSNNGFRPSSPIGVSNRQSSPVTVPSAMQLPYKAPNKVKQIYSFVPLPGAQTQKRPRRRYDEIERIYQCGWNGCEKAYGTLNHLNAHVFMQGHGEKRTPDEIRALWRAKKKEEIKKKQAEEQIRQEEQKRHALTSPQLNQPLSSIQDSQQPHPPNMSHVVYTHLPQPLPNVYPYPTSQQSSLPEPSHQHTYSMPTYHPSLLPHLNQYTTQSQSYAGTNRDYKSHADEEDRDAEGEPDPETSG